MTYGGEDNEAIRFMPAILSKNVNGLQSKDDRQVPKFLSFLRAINAHDRVTPTSVFLIQEHNLKREDSDLHRRAARRLRIFAAINYMPSAEWKGGTAIFIPYDRIEHTKKDESIDEALDRLQKSVVFAAAGRLTRVTATIEGHVLQPTAVYA